MSIKIGRVNHCPDDHDDNMCDGPSDVEELDLNGIKKVWRIICRNCGVIEVRDRKPEYIMYEKRPEQVKREQEELLESNNARKD